MSEAYDRIGVGVCERRPADPPRTQAWRFSRVWSRLRGVNVVLATFSTATPGVATNRHGAAIVASAPGSSTIAEHRQQQAMQLIRPRSGRCRHRWHALRIPEQDVRQHGVGGCQRQRQIGGAEGDLVCRSAEIDPAGTECLNKAVVPSRRGLPQTDPEPDRPSYRLPAQRGLATLRTRPTSSDLGHVPHRAVTDVESRFLLGKGEGEVGGKGIEVRTGRGEPFAQRGRRHE